jgi:hypothetical protein
MTTGPVGLDFATALARRDCATAHAMTSRVYSEAVIVVVALESDTLRIRTVEFGRP